ncbi:hypothetical protein [Patulibacter minatonensis]|uniref:hypothetical protein n=1 Tax=Patulibacter minatonensis TaxID=298163 RepID=UPI00047BC8FB|nr:hypothetical protein [Patulibacter minatonensis]
MDDRARSGPETTWGFVRGALQAVAGVAYLLEDHPTIGGVLLAIAAATTVYTSAEWWRNRSTGRSPVVRATAARRARWSGGRTRLPFRT